MASVTYGKCIMANVIMAKIFMAKILWQMKLSLTGEENPEFFVFKSKNSEEMFSVR